MNQKGKMDCKSTDGLSNRLFLQNHHLRLWFSSLLHVALVIQLGIHVLHQF
jgi:hypothetical protein